MQIDLYYDQIPTYPHALEMYRRGETTGSNRANRKLSEGSLDIKRALTREEEELLFDPQTSGGLLLSLPAGEVEALLKELKKMDIDPIARVGEVVATPFPKVAVH